MTEDENMAERLSKLLSDPANIEGMKSALPGTVYADDEVAPGFHGEHGFRVYDIHAYKVSITKAKLFFDGRTWPNGETAVLETLERLHPDLVALMIRSLAAGYIVGYHSIDRFAGMDWETFNWRGVEDEINRQALALGEIKEVVTLASNHLGQTSGATLRMLRFSTVLGEQAQHVWDLWALVANSSRTAWYSAGVSLGKEYREREVTKWLEKTLS